MGRIFKKNREFFFFFLEMFFIFMHVCINNSEGKDRCLPLYLPFHMEDYAIDIFPIKKMKCNFHQLLITKKGQEEEKSNLISHHKSRNIV